MSILKVGKQAGCWAVIGGLVLAAVCLCGCQTQPSEQQFAELPPGLAGSASQASASAIGGTTSVSTSAAPVSPKPAVMPQKTAAADPGPATAVVPGTSNHNRPEPEMLRVGDSLTVTFTDTPTLIPPFDEKIKDDGTITLTLNQTFKAEGKTTGALEKEIRARYVPDYYKYMTVQVQHQQATRWYYVYGEVKSPSRQIYNTRLTICKAIASVGGFTDFANKKSVRLTRVDGRTFTVNCVKALENPSLDLEVYPGDKIYVKRSLW